MHITGDAGSKRPSRFLRAGGLLLVAALVVACGGPAALAGVVRTPSLEVADVELPDASDGGRPLGMQAPTDELYLVYFGYTSCPDICPTTLSDIRVALDDLPSDLSERVAVAMVTVDPERDTDERLSAYLGYFFDRSHALRTTDLRALEAATAAFGVQWDVEEHDPGESYEVAHTAVTYVVDDTGTVVVEWPFGLETDAMASDLTILLEEEQP